MTLPPITPSGVSTPILYFTQVSGGKGVLPTVQTKPPSVNAPIIFEPGPSFTSGRLLACFIVTAPEPNWGGCQMWGSIDGNSYGQFGVIRQGGVQGLLTLPFPIGSDPDRVNTISVDVSESAGKIVPGSTQDADVGITLAYVDGELIGYSSSVKVGQSLYQLGSYLRRGMFGSTVGSHASGTNFGLINGNVWSQTYPNTFIGRTLYFKFPSFNQVGGELQLLSDCTVYTYTFTGKGATGLVADCPVDTVLAGGASEDWGFLESVISSTCDWGRLGDHVTLSIDCGVLGL